MEEKTIRNILSSFVKDSNDSIRIPIVASLAKVKHHKDAEFFVDYLQDMFDLLSKDESWRVRYAFAEKIDEFLSIVHSSKEALSQLLVIFTAFLGDTEAEVRNISCVKLPAVAEFVKAEEDFEPILKKIANLNAEPESYVKKSLSASLLKFCNKCGKRLTKEYILPTFLNLARDDDHNIRLTLINNIGKIGEVIGAENFIGKIIPPILEVNNAVSWRTRKEMAEILYSLAKAIVYL